MQNYNRTTKKASWNPEELEYALKCIENGTAFREVARTTGIPRETLRTRSAKRDTSAPSLGRKSVFTAEQENMIANHVVKLSKLFYGISSTANS